MKHKQKIALLSVAAIPAVITIAPSIDVQAAQEMVSPTSGSWVNPQHIFDAKSQSNLSTFSVPTSITTTDSATLAEIISTKFKNYETTFTVKYTGPTAGLQAALTQIYTDFDAAQENQFYTAATISRDYTYSGYVNNVTIAFDIKYNTTKAQEEQVKGKIADIIKNTITAGMSEFEKIKTIHDYVVQNATFTKDSQGSPHAAYTLLTEKKGVSQAYALVTYYLLKAAGFEDTHYVTGTAAGTPHAWNVVKYNGNFYHLDTAWDEPAIRNASITDDKAISYQYFLRGSDRFPHTTTYRLPSIASDADASFKDLQNVINPITDESMLYYVKSKGELASLDLKPLPKVGHANDSEYLKEVIFTSPDTTSVSILAKNLVLDKDNGWLYFSNLTDGKGYLYKVKTDGTDFTPVVKAYVTDLQISGTKLTFKKADDMPGDVLLKNNNSAVDTVISLITKFVTSPSPLLQDIVNAKIAYDELSVSQKAIVNTTNYSFLEKEIKNIQANSNDPRNIALRIAQLDETDINFINTVTNLLIDFQTLKTPEERAIVYNSPTLLTEFDKLGPIAKKAIDVSTMIGELNSTKATYFADIKAAKKAFDGLTPAQQAVIDIADSSVRGKLGKEVNALKVAEDSVSDIIYQLNLLNDQAANFGETFTQLDTLIKPFSDSKKALIRNRSIFEKARETHTTYTTEVNKLKTDIETAILSNPTDAQLEALYKRYLAFNPAKRKMFVDLTPNPLLALHTAMADNFAKTNTVEAVVNLINTLKAENPNFMSEVNNAKLAYEAFIAAFPSLSPEDKASLEAVEPRLTVAVDQAADIKTIITAITKIPTSVPSTTTSADTFTVAYTNDVRSVTDKISALKGKTIVGSDLIPEDLIMENHAEKHISIPTMELYNTAQRNITDGNKANDQLNALSGASTPEDVTAARASYTALTDIGKKFVTDGALAKLVAQETRTDQEAAKEVTALILALKQTDQDFLAKLTDARKRFDALTDPQEELVSLEAKTKLTDLEKASENLTKVYNAIEAISEEDVKNYIANYNTAQALYTVLKEDQKLLISNKDKLDAAQENVEAAKGMDADINALSKDSTEEALLAAQEKYGALSPFQKELVTNYSTLESLIDKANGKEEAEAVIDMIAKLDEKKKTFALDVKKAREAFEKLNAKQKPYVTNIKDLEAAEKKVADLAGTSDIAQKMIAQIAAINNTSASFKTDVEAAKNAYTELPEEQQALVNNYNVLKEHLATYDTYAAQAKKLEDQINALSNTSPGYQAALAALQSQYNAFNAAQKAFVPEYAVKLLNAAQSGIDAVRNVTNMILALNPSKSTFHADVANARAAYNALIKNHGVYLAAYLEEALEKAEALVEKDKTAARKVVNAINSLSSDSILKEIERARRVYNNLTALQRPLVTNLQTLIDFETGKLSYNTSGIPDGVDTEDKDTNTEEKSPLPNFAAIPGERTAMTKSKGDTYTAQIYVSNEVGNSERFVLTTRANVTAIIPPTVTVVGDKTGTMAIEIQATSSRVSFKATMDKKPVTFATEVDIIIESVPKNSVILRVDQFGNRVPATYTVDGDQYTIKTNGSDTFIITRSNTTFTDIQNDSHREYIEELAARNIIQNDGNGKFNPNQSITRAEFAVMMARALDIQPSTDTNFNDIRGKSYESEVQALYEAGIIQGVNSTTFNPNSTLTRQQAAMMVERMLDYVNVDTNVWESPQFTDAHLIADSAINAVALMKSLDIVSGKADGSFDPLGKLIRSQLAKILYKALQSADLL
ncbi:S-layer homology domain-containing protein [Lysinibacillus contaminans]|uniref:S-layer homology domain-containing protein n=1 Tax=Lysinibacillus contaminans TaxID=1293441 RepID=UPI0006AEF7F4|nr:S-layer homology domain-containing protein [Lysinibacillus contaminans]